jgi:putative endonuclease
MKKLNFKKGRVGEEIAKKFLLEKGFEIIEQNYSIDMGEIDIIALDNNWLVFVEVKLKVGDRFGTPEEMISKGKIWQIRRVAEMWLLNNEKMRRKYPQQRIDAVCIVTDSDYNVLSLKYYDNLQES